MTRPALVIGLGGTGQWVLTFLKKELLEIGGGALPPGVKLLAFDTTSQTTARTGKGSKQEEEAVRAGAVELDEGKEFIPIGDNVSQLAQEIADGRHSHLQWFPAKTFLAKLPPAAFNTKEGSGQIRQMGRISVFRDLSAINNSQILSRIRAAIQDLQNKVSRNLQLEVIIVGSLAGGTGAGMLVDMALLVRAQASRLVQNNYVVRGFFVLPRAFVTGGLGQDRDMLARAFACWRELDRFMIVSDRFGLRQLNYHEQNLDLRLAIDRRAYDVSYMVDPARQTVNSLDSDKAEEGLFPAIAHVISAVLDEKAGKAYTEFVSTNLAGKLANLPRRPYHSAVGSYTIKVPVYYAQEKFSHQLALDVLREFLAPEVNATGRCTDVSELRNREEPEGHVGKTPVLKFLAASALNIDGNEIPNTKFAPLIGEIREKEAQRENAIVLQWARGGLTNRNSRVFLALTDISQDQEGKLILTNITDELQKPISAYVAPPRARNQTPEQAYTGIKNKVPEVRSEHYGLDTAGGERLRGLYGKALEQAKAAQVARFHKLLHAWTQQTLNGQSVDPRLSRGGKIGYVKAFYRELVDTFTYFIGFLNKVRLARNEELKLASRTGAAARSALLQYEKDKGKKCWCTFFDDFTHPDAHRAARNYLLAEQRDIDVRKDDILLDVLAETAAAMRAIAEKTRDEVDRWIAHLAVGDPTHNIMGLYNSAVESLNNVNVNHEIDKRQGKVAQIIGEHGYEPKEEYITEALGRLEWQVESQVDGLKLTCGVEMPAEDPEAPPRYQAFTREGVEPAKYNLRLLIKLAERPYRTIRQDRPFARQIPKAKIVIKDAAGQEQEKDCSTGQRLAIAVDKLAEPLYLTASVPQGPEIVACYIRVYSDIDEQTATYFDEFEAEMKARNTNIKGSSLTVVDSEDPHKMTIVRSDDLVPSTDFQMWQACRDAYIQQVTDPHRGIPAAELHVFPAEINACYYEAKMPSLLAKNFRTLHPEVVALLEDRDRLEAFFRAAALGFIRMDESRGHPIWVYQLPADAAPLYLTVPPQTSYARIQEDIFQVIHNFVMEGRDQRQGMGQTRWVDWGKLRDAVLGKQKVLGKSKTVKAYREAIEEPNGMVQRIRADVEIRRSTIQDEALRQTVGQEHEDLADLATVIYLEAIQTVEAYG